MTTKIEKIQSLLEGIHEDFRAEAVNDILVDLRSELKNLTAEQRIGWELAIDLIASNYNH